MRNILMENCPFLFFQSVYFVVEVEGRSLSQLHDTDTDHYVHRGSIFCLKKRSADLTNQGRPLPSKMNDFLEKLRTAFKPPHPPPPSPPRPFFRKINCIFFRKFMTKVSGFICTKFAMRFSDRN